MATSPNNWLFNSFENLLRSAACPLRSLRSRTCQWRNQRKCRIRAKGFWVHGMALRPCRKLTPSWLHVWPDSGSIAFITCDGNHTPPSHETGGHDARGYKWMKEEWEEEWRQAGQGQSSVAKRMSSERKNEMWEHTKESGKAKWFKDLRGGEKAVTHELEKSVTHVTSSTASQEPLWDCDTGQIIHVQLGSREKRISLTELCITSNNRHCQIMRQERLQHPAALPGSNCLPPRCGGARQNYNFST